MTLFQNNRKTWIRDIKVGEQVDGYYKVIELHQKTKRDGAPFLTLVLMDKTGKIQAKIWDNVERYLKLITTGEVYKISGVVNEFMGKQDIRITRVSPAPADGGGFDAADFMETASFDTEGLFEQLTDTIKSNLENPYLQQLADLFCGKYKAAFRQHYGAQKIHHAYLGGLLEHTYSMVKLLLFLAEHYSLDKELLLTGALFHDAGKIFEFTTTPSIDTTLAGGLLGHVVIGNNIFLELRDQIPDFPEELSIHLQHLIVSHHGEKEFGSPEVPRTREALALHLVDLLDSKLKIFDEATKKADGKQVFSDYIHPLGRRIYIPKKESGE